MVSVPPPRRNFLIQLQDFTEACALKHVRFLLRVCTPSAAFRYRGQMAQDRVDGNELKLTHEFLAVMLGVRRSGITTAIQESERKGLIAHRRTVVIIIDREGLEESSNGTYLPPNDNS
jgi:hypothetical protein